MTSLPVPLDDALRLRSAIHQFPSGVVAVCALVDGRPDGMLVSRFLFVSSSPPLVAVCIHAGSPQFPEGSKTWPRLEAQPRLGVGVLGAGHVDVARAIYGQADDRFATFEWEATDTGAVFVTGSPLYLESSVHSKTRLGSHDLVVLAVERAQADPDVEPLVFHSDHYRQLGAGDRLAIAS